MGLRLQLCLALFAMLSLAVYAQELKPDMGDYQIKLEGETEFEDGEERDLKFDAEILDVEDRPEKEPDPREVAMAFSRSRDSLAKSADPEVSAEVVEKELSTLKVSLYSEYLSRASWYPTSIYRCCPAIQRYGCGTTQSYQHPCFYHWVNGRREWCCSFAGHVTIKNCNCSKCFSLRRDCIYEGRCLRRYTKRTFWAVCYNSWWGIFRRISRWVPTSCYCRLNRYQPFCSLRAADTLTKA